MNLLALAWLSEVGLLTYRATTKGRPAAAGGGKIPWPADFAATFVIFGALSIVSEIGGGWDKVGAAAGWAVVLASVINLVDPTEPAGMLSAGTAAQASATKAAAAAQSPPPTGNPLVLALRGTS